MAVVQISRIQVRRGRVAQGTSLPQLASGELAWAIDSQELWIGNGSVSEGSPGVGNTKILTLNDLSANGNILGIIQYIYNINQVSTGLNGGVTSRSIQNRLDDIIISTDFGTLGDGILTSDNKGYTTPSGSPADGPALQLAINQLYLNSLPAYSDSGVAVRYTLNVPAGVYILPSTLYIPSHTTIVGAGSDKTIFYYTGSSTVITHTANSGGALSSYTVVMDSVTNLVQGMSVSGVGVAVGATITNINGLIVTMSLPATSQISGQLSFNTNTLPAVQFVNDSFNPKTNTVTASTTRNNQPRNIRISGVTVWTALGTNAAFQMDNVRDSNFSDIYFKGNAFKDNAGVPNTNSIALQMNAFSSVTTTQHNVFRDCKFENFYAMINAKGDIRNINWDNCYFYYSIFGFLFGIDTNGVIANGTTTGQEYGPRQCVITACKFNRISEQALLIQLGVGNMIDNARLVNVGSLGQQNGLTQYPQIYFGVPGNKASNIYSDRSVLLSDAVHITTPYVPEVSGYTTYMPYSTNTFNLIQQTNPTYIFRLPTKTTLVGSPTGSIIYTIDYIYTSTHTSFSRKGQLTLIADVAHIKTQLSDDYVYAGANETTDALDLDFTMSFLDSSGVKYTGAVGQMPYAIGIYYTNSLPGDTGTLTVTYTSVS